MSILRRVATALMLIFIGIISIPFTYVVVPRLGTSWSGAVGGVPMPAREKRRPFCWSGKPDPEGHLVPGGSIAGLLTIEDDGHTTLELTDLTGHQVSRCLSQRR